MSGRQRSERGPIGGDPYKTAIVRLMREFSHSHNQYTVFSDFIEISAIAISNKIDAPRFEAREKRYLEIVGKYKPEEVQRFCAMFAELHMCYRARVDALGDQVASPAALTAADSLGDVLGEIFMALDLGNDRAGQFFTPYSVSLLMAMMTIGDGAAVREKGFITLQEPACGSAGMVVATAQAMHAAGLSYPETLHATCVDIDLRCVHMAYVQLSLLGIPAVVVHGNALSLEVWDVWYTPAHALIGWGTKLRHRRATDAMAALLREGREDDGADSSGDVVEAPVQPTEAEAIGAVEADIEPDVAVVDDVYEKARHKKATHEKATHEKATHEKATHDSPLVDLFEQLSASVRAEKTEPTIFDRIDQIDQLALF